MSKTKVKSNCKICNKETLVNKAVISGNLPVYCSSECKSLRYEHNCEICDKYFRNSKADTRTCSRSCQTELRRRKVIKVKCYLCNLEFERPTSDVYEGKRVFCSKKCRDNQHSLDNPSRYGTNWKSMRKKAIIRDNNKCTVCGKSDELEVHHLIKLKTFKNPNDANYLDNLKTVCNSCHKDLESKDIV